MTNSKDYLSQEEIDALLKQTVEDEAVSELEEDSELSVQEVTHINQILSEIEQDVLGEIGNITFGNAATALSTLLGKKVDITTPQISFVKRSELQDEFPKPHVSVHVKYIEGFEGINSLLIKTNDAQIIANLMLGGDGIVSESELDEIQISAIQEAMNQMMGSSATSMSTIFNRLVNISPPAIDILNVADGEGVQKLPADDILIKVSFRLRVGDLIDSTLMQLLPVDFAKDMVSNLVKGGEAVEEEELVQAAAEISQNQVTEQELNEIMEQEAARAESQAQASVQKSSSQSNLHSQRDVNVQPVQYASFSGESHMNTNEVNLDLLLDIPLKVTVELGRTRRLIKDILEFTHGSIIELDKLAGEPVDILVNNKLIAKGEVVVIDENFGVRVTDIVSKMDRLQKLQ